MTHTITPADAEWITPLQAKEWLGTNFNNRRLNERSIAKLIGALERNEWNVNGETIKFDVDGNLIDGQHRLWACLQSNTGLRSLVVRDLPRKVQETVDTGKPRTVANILGMRGYANSHSLASATNMTMKYYLSEVTSSRLTYTEAQKTSFLEDTPELIEGTKMAGALRKIVTANPTVMATAWVIFNDIDAEACGRFFDSLRSGAGLSEHDPILVLRNRIASERSSKRKLEPEDWLAYFIKTWNDWRTGRTRQLLQWRRDEQFPVAV